MPARDLYHDAVKAALIITYHNFFTRSGIDLLVQANQVSLVVVDIEQREIVIWKS